MRFKTPPSIISYSIASLVSSFNSGASGKSCVIPLLSIHSSTNCNLYLFPFLHETSFSEITKLPVAKCNVFLPLVFKNVKFNIVTITSILKISPGILWHSLSFFPPSLVTLLFISFSFYCILKHKYSPDLVLGFYFLTPHISSDLSFYSYSFSCYFYA